MKILVFLVIIGLIVPCYAVNTEIVSSYMVISGRLTSVIDNGSFVEIVCDEKLLIFNQSQNYETVSRDEFFLPVDKKDELLRLKSFLFSEDSQNCSIILREDIFRGMIRSPWIFDTILC